MTTLADLCDAVTAHYGAPFAASYIETGGLDPHRLIFIPRTAIAWERLKERPGMVKVFGSLGVRMQHPRKTSEFWP